MSEKERERDRSMQMFGCLLKQAVLVQSLGISTVILALAESLSLSLDVSVSASHLLSMPHRDTNTHIHFYKIQYNWNNLLWEDKTKMREIKWLAWDQAHSLMQDYRLDTVTHTRRHKSTHIFTHSYTDVCICAPFHYAQQLTNLCKSLNSYKYIQECMDNCIRHSSCPIHWNLCHTHIK